MEYDAVIVGKVAYQATTATYHIQFHQLRIIVMLAQTSEDTGWPFEKIATAYEYSSTQSAERAYKKVIRKLQRELAV